MPTHAEIEAFSDKLEAEFGLVFDEGRREQVQQAMLKRCTELGLTGEEYLERLDSDRGEWSAVAALLTVPESYFFRHPDHLRAFTEHAVPERIAAHPADRTLRISCIGCANGEEPYTLSMLLQDPAALDGWHFRIRACDINPEALQRARRATYTNWALRATPPVYRSRYFTPAGNRHRISEVVRTSVEFDQCNVLNLYRPEGAGMMDVVFFRNVLIYFSPEAIRAAINTVAHLLAPGGYLFLGPAETLRGVSDDFELRHTHDTFYYQRKAAISELIPFSPFHQLPVASVPAPDWLAPDMPAEPLPAAAPMSALADLPTTEWMEEIERSTQRIKRLDVARGKGPLAAERPRRKRWEMSCGEELKNLMSMYGAERYGEILAGIRNLPREIAEDSDIQLLKALSHLNRREMAEAEEVARAALARDSMDAGGQYVLALCSEHAQNFAASAEHDRIAIYLDPNFAMPHMHLGLVARRRGDRHTARREFEKAILLLARESASRIAMFGGGFSREALRNLCRRELQAIGAA